MPFPTPALTLNQGPSIPQIGFGTWRIGDGEAQAAVASALAAGYRHIDTAALYGNEAGVGAGLAASGLDRADVFITTKLANTDQKARDVIGGFERSLDRLGFDYVDLYLIHWPLPAVDAYVETWRAFERIAASGRARAVGVSNFMMPHLERLIRDTGLVPAVNQVELHPLFQQPDLRDFHASAGIATEAWGPLGRGKYDLAQLPAIATAAAAHAKTPAQVVLRWEIQEGIVTIPKTSRPERMAENLDIFDFSLSDDEIQSIRALDTGVRRDDSPLDVNA
jgi:2,5-diketo-D-gluconate reductase A